MRFEGTGEELEINIKKIRYSQKYDMIIWTHSA
jgi:hypothetical protein